MNSLNLECPICGTINHNILYTQWSYEFRCFKCKSLVNMTPKSEPRVIGNISYKLLDDTRKDGNPPPVSTALKDVI